MTAQPTSDLSVFDSAGRFGQSGQTPQGSQAGPASLFDIWKILAVLRKWFWLIGLIILGTMAATFLMLSRSTPVYKATSTLEIKQEERNIIEVSAIESVTADEEFLETQVELLKSDTLARDVIENLNLLSDPYFVGESEEFAALPREDRLRRIVTSFKENLSVDNINRTRLIRVSFEHTSPTKAAEIINTLTDTFVSNSLSRKFNATTYAREFLEGRLEIIKGVLEESERELFDYASSNNIVIIERGDEREVTGSLDTASLVTLSQELSRAQSERVVAENEYQQSIENKFASDVLTNGSLNELKAQRIALNSEYLDKLGTFKPDYPEMLDLKARIDLFEQQIATITDNIIEARRAETKYKFDAAKAREGDLTQRIAVLKGSVLDIREKSIDYNILKRQVDTNRTQYDALLQRLKEVSVTDNLGANLVEVVDEASPPQLPFRPRKMLTLALALLLSSAFGFGLAYAIETIDDRVKSPDDVRRKLSQILMGVIPLASQKKDILEALQDPQSGIAESYGSVRTNLQFSGSNGGPRIIQVTSTRSGEGKSVTSLALAMRFAGLGSPVLLIDADMRLPTFSPRAGGGIGLSGLLTRDIPFESEIAASKFDNLYLIQSGRRVPNPSEILSSARFEDLLAYAREHFEYIIVDSPPVLGLADAPVLGAKVDATLLVVQAGLLRTGAVLGSIERLKSSGTKLLGVVMSKYAASTASYMDSYSYTYGGKSRSYGSTVKEDETKPSSSKRKFDILPD